MTRKKTPRDVLKAFYEAEKLYMQAKAKGEEASFDGIAATLDEAVVLHQSPDLPFGGEYVGHKEYEQWAKAMSSIFDTLEVAEQEWFESGNKVVVLCRFVTHSRINGSSQSQPMAQVVTVLNGKITDFRPFYWNVPAYTSAAGPS